MAPAVSGRLLAVEVTVEFQTSPFAIFGGHNGSKTLLTWVIRFFSPTVVLEWGSSQAHHSRFSNFEFPFLSSVLGTEFHLLVLTVSFGPSCCYDWKNFPFNRHIPLHPSHISIDLNQNDTLKMEAKCVLKSSESRGRIRKETHQIHVINHLKTKRRLLYLKTQSVPRCKHFISRL